MIAREIGSSGIIVPAIGIGTAGFGGRNHGKSNSRRAEAIVRSALDLGISFIDTAEAYEDGNSEIVVGEAIRGIREKAFIATKFSPQHSRPQALTMAFEASLRRLQTDYIDLYQMHWPNPSVPIGETLNTLEELVDRGKLRLIGLCNSSLKWAGEVRDGLSSPTRLAAIQNEYNLLERSCEKDLLPFCQENGITFVAHSPLNHGSVLEGDDRMVQIASIAKEHGITVAQLVLSWVIRNRSTLAIPRTLNAQHVKENAAVLDIHIRQRDYDRISEVFRPRIIEILPKSIEIVRGPGRCSYRTMDEARDNRFGYVPGPVELAREIQGGETLKLIKVRSRETLRGPRYQLIEGEMRYWAWVIANGYGRAIPALVQG